ncbi:MAG: tRNA lysidine(34) synthetase TilS [Phycisphaerales bacterium]
MQRIEEKIRQYIEQKNLIPAGGKILVAVSGGADSVCLLYILNKLFPNQIHAAHINHQLRASDSLDDEYYVKTLANKLAVPVTVELADVTAYAKKEKLSIETAARQLRLAALVKIADKNNCSVIATAHHKNDNAETVIHRILRGTGFKGLAGIRSKTIYNEKTFIRPLLCLTRIEIEEYLNKQNIAWQNDYTNADCRFTRNRIRHKLLPFLTNESPKLVEILNELAGRCENFANNIEEVSAAAQKDCFICETDEQVIIDSAKFKQLSSPVQVELIQKALTQLKCGLREYSFHQYRKIIDFVNNATVGKKLTIPGKIKIIKSYNKFFVGNSKIKNLAQAVVLNVPGKTNFEDFEINTELIENPEVNIIRNKKDNVELFDFAQIKFPIMAREREKGDKFRPFGQNKFKKVGKFLTSEKIDIAQRKVIFIISDNEKILWVVSARRSSEAKVDSQSRKLLKITVTTTK